MTWVAYHPYVVSVRQVFIPTLRLCAISLQCCTFFEPMIGTTGLPFSLQLLGTWSPTVRATKTVVRPQTRSKPCTIGGSTTYSIPDHKQRGSLYAKRRLQASLTLVRPREALRICTQGHKTKSRNSSQCKRTSMPPPYENWNPGSSGWHPLSELSGGPPAAMDPLRPPSGWARTILEAEIVTADGSLISVSPTENSDSDPGRLGAHPCLAGRCAPRESHPQIYRKLRKIHFRPR
jgi:hypothetical protein